MPLHTYLPQDRLRAISRGETLPDRTTGSALFADISGFTTLTEGLRESLGARQGAEELTKHLAAVYTALIAEIERYGGSVIGFAGDAITCWFDDAHGPAAPRATASAFALQAVMRSFAVITLPSGKTTGLALKVAIATGAARRFVVGDPTINYLDALAGATVARTSTAEHLSQKGDVLVDEVTVNALGEALTIKEWRNDPESGERFAVVTHFASESAAPVLPATTRPPAANKLRVWLQGAVYDREGAGQESFLTEFRPCVVLFVRFIGIDYDSDLAEKQLDTFVRQTQNIVEQYAGTLLDITIGDKGSYAYINFGALISHEDNARRAVKAGLEIKNRSELQLQMGITQGTLRVGAYGGVTRKTFGALGDEVNLAARLMTNAATGEILISGQVHKAVENYFSSEPRAPLAMKGKAEPLPVFAVTGERNQRAIRLQEPTYALPMVGREQELGIINDKLGLAEKGQGQVIGIIAEAGMGKSRLVAEVIRLARKKGFAGYGGACQSDAVNTPYQTWKSIWQAFFDVDPSAPLKKQMRNLEGEIEDRVPERVQAMPLLNVVLGLEIPDNDFTQTLEPQYRKSALRALLEDCLRAAAKDEPLLIIIEDMHWIDALSHDLLEELARALNDSRVCFVLAYRPPQLARLEAPRLEAMPNFTKIELHELNQAEAESAIRAKLAQLYPSRGGALPSGLVDKLMSRSQGNPFYLEELLNYVRDRGLDPADLNKIELPDSLHTLILSRIDQLSEREKTTLRVASIVGRLFRVEWLTGYYPELGGMNRVQSDLEQLAGLDITPLDTPEPELAYLFKHIVTHEVTYESLPFSLRAQLHEQLARYLEKQIANGTLPEATVLDTLAFHYTHSNNAAKQREYLRKAGESAQKSFANDAALEYYGRLLPLLNDPKEQAEVHLKRGQVSQLMGNWNEAESDFRAGLELVNENAAAKANAQQALGKLNRLRGNYESALNWLSQAKEARTALGDVLGLVAALIQIGQVLFRKGENAQARVTVNEALALAHQAGDKQMIGGALVVLGNMAYDQADYPVARELHAESLALYREMGDKVGISWGLNNLGLVAMLQGDQVVARELYEESLTIDREMGDKWGIAIDLGNLGAVAVYRGDFAAARGFNEECLALLRELGDKASIANGVNNQGLVANLLGDYVLARERFEEALALARGIEDKAHTATALSGLGLVDVAEHKPEARENFIQSIRLRQETGDKLRQTSNLIGMAGLAVQEGDPGFAAQLLGAVESAVKALNAEMEPELKPFHARTLAAVREQLGEAVFQSAWEEGQRMTLEEAVGKALEE